MYNNTKHTGAHNAQDALNEGTVHVPWLRQYSPLASVNVSETLALR